MEQTNTLDSNKISSPFALIDPHTEGTFVIKVMDEEPSYGPYSRSLLTNVEISISESGNMHLKGDMVECFGNTALFGEPLTYQELVEKDKFVLDESRTYRNKFCKWEYGPVLYHDKWIDYKERKPYEISTSNYRICRKNK